MVIDINDSLLESIKKELLDALDIAENRVTDIFDFGETHGSDEALEQLSAVRNTLIMLAELPAAELCGKLQDKIKQSLTDSLPQNEGIATAFLTLTQYVNDLSATDKQSTINLSKAAALLDENQFVKYPLDEQQRSNLEKLYCHFNNALVNTEGIDFWQTIYKVSQAAKQQVKTQENYEYIWLIQQLAVLHIKGENKASKEASIAALQSFKQYFEQLINAGERTENYLPIQDNIVSLRELTDHSGNVLKSDYSPPSNKLVLANDGLGIVFPVDLETIESIAFHVKKELSITKDLFESSLTANTLTEPKTTAALKESLQSIKSAFKLLAFRAGQSLLEDCESLLNKLDTDEQATIDFTRNVVLIEDALWQLNVVEDSGILNPSEAARKQSQHTLTMAVDAAKSAVASAAHQFFKENRDTLIDQFESPEQLDSMALAGLTHQIKSSMQFLGESQLSVQLQQTERSHLFLNSQSGALEDKQSINAYLDLLVAYEIIFEQFQQTLSIDKRALKWLENAQQRFTSGIKFNIEQMATPDYLNYSTNKDAPTAATELPKNDLLDKEVPEIDDLDTATRREEATEDVNGTEASLPEATKPSDQASAEVAQQIASTALGRAATQHAAPNQEVQSDEIGSIDEDILEIFLEEGQEIFRQLEKNVPALKGNYFDKDLSENIRRAYHTLKGSGRMVGLHVFGEFAWQHEDLLNRAANGEFELSDDIQDLLEGSNELVRQTVFSEPFTENRDLLLRRAATAEAMGKILTGKIPLTAEDSAETACDNSAEISPATIIATGSNAQENNALDSLPIEQSQRVISELASHPALSLDESEAVAQEIPEPQSQLADDTDTSSLTLAEESIDELSTVDDKAASQTKLSEKIQKPEQNADTQLKQLTQTAQLVINTSDSLSTDLGAVLSAINSIDKTYFSPSKTQLSDILYSLASMLKTDRQNKLLFTQAQTIVNALEAMTQSEANAQTDALAELEHLRSELNKSIEKTDSPTVNSQAIAEALQNVGNESDSGNTQSAIDPATRAALAEIIKDLNTSGELILTPQQVSENVASQTPRGVSPDDFAQFIGQSTQHTDASQATFSDWESNNFQKDQHLDDLKKYISEVNQAGEQVNHLDSQLLTQSLSDTLSNIEQSEQLPTLADFHVIKGAIDNLEKMYRSIMHGEAGEVDNEVLQQLSQVDQGIKAPAGEAEREFDPQLDRIEKVIESLEKYDFVSDKIEATSVPNTTPLQVEPYFGEAKEVSEHIKGMRGHFSSGGYTEKGFEHNDFINSIYDLEASVDTAKTPDWAWEALSNLENTISGMRDRNLMPSPKDQGKVDQALDAVTSPEDISGELARKINNDLMNIRADLATRQRYSQTIKQFMDNVELDLKSTTDALERWQNTGYAPSAALDDLMDQLETIGEKATKSEYKEAQQLSSLVSGVLDRIHTDNVVPFDDVSSDVQSAVEELTSSEQQYHGDKIRHDDLISGLTSYFDANELGTPYVPDPEFEEAASDAIEEAINSTETIPLSENVPNIPTEIAEAAVDKAMEKFLADATITTQASQQHYADWETAEFKDTQPLENLIDSVDQTTGLSEAHSFNNASQLSQLVSQILKRLHSDSLRPDADTADNVSAAIDELANNVQSIAETQSDEHLNKDLINSTQSVASRPVIGSPVTGMMEQMPTSMTDDDLSTSQRDAIDSSVNAAIQEFVAAASSSTQSSQQHFSEWETTEFNDTKPLESLIDSIDQTTALSQQHEFNSTSQLGGLVSQVLNRLYDENIKPNETTAEDVSAAIDELTQNVQSISKHKTDAHLDQSVMSNTQALAKRTVIGVPLTSDTSVSSNEIDAVAPALATTTAATPAALDASETAPDKSIEQQPHDAIDASVDAAIQEFVALASASTSASQQHYADWETTEFNDTKSLESLIDSIDQTTDTAQQHDFENTSQLGSLVSNVLNRLYDEDLKPNEKTAENVSAAIDELANNVQSIAEHHTDAHISQDIVEQTQALASRHTIGTPQLASDSSAAATTNVTNDDVDISGQAQQPTKASETVSSETSTATNSTRSSSEPRYQQFAREATPHIETSQASFSDWENADFSASEPLEQLSSSVGNITQASKDSELDRAAQLGESVGEILDRVSNEQVKPYKTTTDTVSGALDEFERTASAIRNNDDQRDIDESIIQDVTQTAKAQDIGIPLSSSTVAYDTFAQQNYQEQQQASQNSGLFGTSESVASSEATSIDSTPSIMTSQTTAPTVENTLESNDPNTLDTTILDIFIDEARDILKRNRTSLGLWEKDSADLSALQDIQRGMHTLKGGARMAELSVLGDLTHHLESLLDYIVDGQIADKSGAANVLKKGLTLSNNMVETASAHQPIYESPEFFEALSAFLEKETGKPLKQTSKKQRTSSAGVEASIAPQTATVKKKAKKKKASYSLRIQSDLIDKLSSLVGEDSIARARIERNTTAHEFQLLELSRTIIRVTEQLRRMENETEAQILFRHETNILDDEVDEMFDPLELDRFSELQQLSRLLAESMNDLQNISSSLGSFVDETKQILNDQSNIQHELQDGILSASLVRFDSIQSRIETLIHQVADETQKEVELQIYGGQIEIERNMLEELLPGFEHAIRNSLAHGIELPAEREKAGKPRKGRIRIGVRREGSQISFVLADDGRGADLEAIRKKAERLGILDASRADDKNYLLQLLFEAGFSTAEETTQLSGRGIGLDVLKEVVNARQGSIEVETETGIGLATSIRMPFTMSITDALIIKVGQYFYAVPVMSIEGVARIPSDLQEQFLSGAETYYSYGQNSYKMESLIDFIDPQAERIIQPHGTSALLIRVGSKRLAFEIEEIYNRQEIIIKSVNAQLTSLPGIIGAAILDDGQPVPVLEATTLGRHFLNYKQSGLDIQDQISSATYEFEDQQTRILVVDDSITMRKITTKILNKYDVETKTAKDGLEAIDTVVDWVPDLILLDIEMPRMDGFEFATHVRNDSIIKDTPIIMITSRTGDKHRQRADSIGVNDYLGKPYTEEVLINAIENILNTELSR